MICLKCSSKSVVKARLILYSGIAYEVMFCQACEHVTRVKDSRPAAAYEHKRRCLHRLKHGRRGGDK